MMSGTRGLAILNGLGLVVSTLVLASGIIWYPLILAAVVATLPLLIVVVAGIWLGAIWPARLALGVGNAAVVAGFAGVMTLFGLASVSINPVFFFGAALMLALGYALIAMSVARGLLARWIPA